LIHEEIAAVGTKGFVINIQGHSFTSSSLLILEQIKNHIIDYKLCCIIKDNKSRIRLSTKYDDAILFYQQAWHAAMVSSGMVMT
jgi:hypothetical protein